MNLGRAQPATVGWPLYTFPPPHFLVGYQYIVRVCNDYIFDSRAYSRIQYHEIHAPMQQLINWSVMTTCNYTINTGAYHRFIDLENFEETLAQVQQAILAERVVADLELIRPMRGYGSTAMADLPDSPNVPVEFYLQQQRRHIGECQDQPWGLAERVRIHQAGRKDLVILTAIKKLKSAFFNFIMNTDAEPILSLPCDCDWLNAFVNQFSGPVDPGVLIGENVCGQKVIKAIISALSLPNLCPIELTGGAFELRPRENGRAVTEEMRRRRGEVVQRFIDSLPFRRRRRRRARAAISPSPEPRPGPSRAAEAEAATASIFEAAEALPEEPEEPGPSAQPFPPSPSMTPPRAPGDAARSFAEEVRAGVAEAIRLLQEELTVSVRDQRFFNFAVDFYRAMQQLDLNGLISETSIRRWVMYFFATEHIATTLNYLHFALRQTGTFTRHVELNLGQIVLRARDQNGEIIYSRVWNEYGPDAFLSLMRRISTDLSATIERAGLGELDEDEVEQFMADIAYQENSGDVSEILRQVELNDAVVNSMEFSFRFKVTGPVILSLNRDIQNINRRVVALASRLRSLVQPIPDLNAVVELPPL